MAKIISYCQQKGGSGKSSLAVNTAGALAEQGAKVLLVDADKQGSLIDWAENREQPAPFVLVAMPSNKLHREVEKVKQDYDYIVIDGPGASNSITKSAILAADIVVMPVQPSPYDVWASDVIVELIEEVQNYRNDDIHAAWVISRKQPNTIIGREVRKVLDDTTHPVLKAEITQRISIAESVGQGMTVLEFDPKSAAAQEIRTFVDEILELMNVKDSLVWQKAHGE